MSVTLGVPGRIMPPADKAIEFAQKAEADGYDAVWWPCHLMGWIPDSVWTEDMTGLAKYQANPHVHFDPLTMMGAAGAATERIRVGVNVTDTIRRHPAMLAQTALTVDHLARGRSILGLGSGERHERHAIRDRVAQAGRAARGGDQGHPAACGSPTDPSTSTATSSSSTGRSSAWTHTKARRRRSGSARTARGCSTSAGACATAGCRRTSRPRRTRRSCR